MHGNVLAAMNIIGVVLLLFGVSVCVRVAYEEWRDRGGRRRFRNGK